MLLLNFTLLHTQSPSALEALRDFNILQLPRKTNPPLSEGILIADEVKMAAKLHWNSCSDILVRHSMTPSFSKV